MGLSLVTASTSEPVSLAEVKAHMRVSGSDEDGLIAGYLIAARAYAQTYTRRAFAAQTWDESFDYDWPRDYCFRPRIVLAMQPVASITSVTYVPDTGGSATLTSGTHYVSKLGDDQVAVIEPAYDVTWPSVRRQLSAVTVRYVAGYARLPEEIRQAILLLAEHSYENREAVVIGQAPSELPIGVEALLSPYRLP